MNNSDIRNLFNNRHRIGNNNDNCISKYDINNYNSNYDNNNKYSKNNNSHDDNSKNNNNNNNINYIDDDIESCNHRTQ